MNKKFLLIILLLNCFYVFSQSYKISYAFSLVSDPDSIKNQQQKNYYKTIFIPEHQNNLGVLWITPEGTMFEQEGTLKNVYGTAPFITSRFTSKKDQRIYLKKNKNLVKQGSYYYRNFIDYNWLITTEQKSIDGFTCYKAVGSLKSVNGNPYYMEAWFSPEIPIPYGPEDYAGLPGLIFEAYRLNGLGVHWKLKSIEKNKTKVFNLPDPDDVIHYESFDKIFFDEMEKLKRL
ncbi:GLPGLI family protein [Flavobacterium agricola]|uniref:GLPGLI family protein n=1 Tax=Flavobacterium agricola TaxID=2870839 RepID=A0ABY6LWU3_9FLAO|nr:GLPGLI family protein [Flavobacterium agricola]UYW00802.1 GLPGLI family protein [Flavobacterium agricola]